MRSHLPLKYIVLLGLSAALSSLTVVLGAIPMRAIRVSYGRIPFWLGHIAVATLLLALGFKPYSLLVSVLTVLVGVYSEVEEHGSSVFHSGMIALLAAVGSSAFAVGLNLYWTKANLLGEVRSQIKPLVDKLTEMNPQAQVSLDTIVHQLPSALLITMVVAIGVALIWERRLLSLFHLPNRGAFSLTRDRLLEFRVPDLVIWMTMLSLLGAFVQHGNEWVEIVSVNLINVFVVFYFFQGLSIVAYGFQRFKVGTFWQTFWYLMIVIQLFLIVSMLGFADFWLGFRDRLSRKPAETNKSF